MGEVYFNKFMICQGMMTMKRDLSLLGLWCITVSVLFPHCFQFFFCQCCHLILVLKCQLVDHILQIDDNVELAIKQLLKERDTYLFKQGTEKLISQYDWFSVITWTIRKSSMSCSGKSCTLEIQWITLSYVYLFFIVSDCIVAYSSSFPPFLLPSVSPYTSFLPPTCPI